MKYSTEFPHPDTGNIVNATLSECCNTSVSFNPQKKGQGPPYYTCNKCRKVTLIKVVPYWEITKGGHYKPIKQP